MSTTRDIDALITAEAYRCIKHLKERGASCTIYGKQAKNLTYDELDEYAQRLSKDFILSSFNKWFDEDF